MQKTVLVLMFCDNVAVGRLLSTRSLDALNILNLTNVKVNKG
jgi:hypothetical protein